MDLTEITPQRLESIWQVARPPVLFHSRKSGHPLFVRLPYEEGFNAYWWLYEYRCKRPVYNRKRKAWMLPSGRFESVTKKTVERYGSAYVVQVIRELERCAPACMKAQGVDCQCSCAGKNHGFESDHGWFVVSETFAVRRGRMYYSCRLISARKK